MKLSKFSSLFLALALQVMPLCRVVLTPLLPSAPTVAIVIRWLAGAVALAGACHAVSGASTVITSPTTARGTNGVAFSYRITTGPEAANQFNAAPLPPGLTLATTTGRITGNPSSNGVWSVRLTASDSGIPSRTVTATLTMTIVAGSSSSPPTITSQPQSQTVTAGTNVMFSVGASGMAPLSYQWSLGGTNLQDQTNSTLNLVNVISDQVGNYTVLVSDPAGSVLSDIAQLQILTYRPGPPLSLKDVAGRYTGLLYDTNGVGLGSSGFFTFTLSPRGTYTAAIALSGGWRLAASGALAVDGTGQIKLERARSIPVLVKWAVDLTGSGQISGTIASSSGSWLAELSGDRAVFNMRTNPCPYAGRYTFLIPGTPGSMTAPAGDSYGTLTAEKNGIATLRSWLADKSSGVQRAPISSRGDLPLFVPLYSKTGGLLAWIHFAERSADDFHGLLSWIKPASPVAAFYPGGFDQTLEMAGSLYTPPANSMTAVLSLTSGTVTLTDGNLPVVIAKNVAAAPGQKMLGAGPDLLRGTFAPATGLFNGSYLAFGITRPIALHGVAFQKGNYASGFFLGKDQSGRVLIEPVSPGN